LTEVENIRKKVEGVKVDSSAPLENQEQTAKGAVDDLQVAKSYLDIARKDFNFDPGKIDDEASRLGQAIQFRDFQHNSILANIKQRDEREAAAKAAEEARLAAQKKKEDRDKQYQGDLDQFSNILRCKGDISDPDLAQLNGIINGPTGLKATYPAQFEVDKPGIVAALKGCIEQRIGVRAPKRAREIKAKVMTYLPGEPALASIQIEDLDPCAVRSLEGNGNRNGNWCSDRLAVGGTGPDMVVVPKSPAVDHKFAIGRIEVKVSDFNRYCESEDGKTAGCKPISGPGTVPVTGISLKQAEAYAKWLSDESGKTYRLPTPKEWEYAAKTNQEEPIDANVNCTVDSRGVRLGEKMQSALSGRPNKWGLYNFVGNAREWAVSRDDKVYALGGARTTPKSQCDTILQEPLQQLVNSGKADDITGFRLVREIEG
ncbi:MAG TPA: SUMF1/EgtB/PvdO family nonheme iron enzyme, partial [Pseudomonadales bacterium]|nr:SUMF1/EgtB/PvdO family nonheme iron enzyme [Pseudomonadales bacterium]